MAEEGRKKKNKKANCLNPAKKHVINFLYKSLPKLINIAHLKGILEHSPDHRIGGYKC